MLSNYGQRGGIRNRIAFFETLLWALGSLFVFLGSSEGELLEVDLQDLDFDWFEESEDFASIAVMALHQDSRGFIWIGTRDGVYRYDGERFVGYRAGADEERLRIPENSVTRFFEDSAGRLWVGLEGAVVHYDYRLERFVAHEVESDQLNAVLFQERPDGRLMFFNLDGALFELKDSGAFREVSSGISDWARCSHAAKDGTYFIGGRFGIRRYSSDLEEVRYYNAAALLGGTSDSYFTALGTSSDGKTLWAGTSNFGVWMLDIESGDFTRLSSRSMDEDLVGSIMVDERGFVLVGTTAGLTVYEKDGDFVCMYRWNRYDTRSIPTGTVYSMLNDSQGNLWVGTTRGGLSIVRPSKGFDGVDDLSGGFMTLTKQKVTALFRDSRERLWVGYHNESIDVFDTVGKSKVFIDAHDPNGKTVGRGSVWSVAQTSDGSLWVGCNRGGLSWLKHGREDFEQFVPDYDDPGSISGWDIRGVLPDEKENLWLLLHGFGIDYFDRSTSTFRHYDNAGRPWVEDLLLDRDGNLWVSSADGLTVLSAGSDAFEVWEARGPSSLGLPDNHVICLMEDADGNIWVGTRNGLCVLGLDRRVLKHYTRKEGLPSVSIRSITQSAGGEIWVATSGGLARFDSGEERFKSFFREDGLLSNEFTERASFIDGDGRIYFGCEKGIVAFDPQKIRINQVPPKLAITGVSLYSELVYPSTGPDSILQASPIVGDEIVLPAGKNTFGFRFAALDYTSGERVSYEYKLEGFEEQWIRNGSRSDCSYTNIPPGDYVFRVRASNSDGVWNEEGASLAVSVLPFFWQTHWFIATVVAILILFFVLVIQFRTASLARQGAVLRETVSRRTHELEEALYELELQKAQIEDQNLELLDHRENLEGLVEQRTEELLEAKERAEESDRLKTAFLENISHEIRTPMNAIMGFVNILSSGCTDAAEEQEYFEIIEKNGEYLTRLIDDIIEMSILETSGVTLRSESIDLHGYFSTWHFYLQKELKKLGNEGIEARLFFDGNSNARVFVSLDPLRLGQILKNLLDNAVKFTDEGYIEVRYGLDEGVLFFEVSDSGIGIPEDKLGAVFSLFRKIQSEGKRLYRGTGLGLALVKRVVDLLGGEIRIESESGKGTRVFVRMPVNDSVSDR